MMTTAEPTTTTTSGCDQRGRPTTEASAIVFFGTVAWLAYVWLAATVIYAVVVACVARWGSVDESLWQSVASAWQRYVVFASGVTVSPTFVRMLVRNGVTRRVVSIGAAVTMTGLAVILAVWNLAGYAIEKVIYDRYDWPLELRSGTLLDWGDLPRLAIDNGLVIAAYYAAGWIVGVCYARWGAIGGTLRLLPALLPVVLMELMVTPDVGADIDVIASWRNEPPVVLSIVGGAALLVVTVWVARRLTRDVTLRC